MVIGLLGALIVVSSAFGAHAAPAASGDIAATLEAAANGVLSTIRITPTPTIALTPPGGAQAAATPRLSTLIESGGFVWLDETGDPLKDFGIGIGGHPQPDEPQVVWLHSCGQWISWGNRRDSDMAGNFIVYFLGRAETKDRLRCIAVPALWTLPPPRDDGVIGTMGALSRASICTRTCVSDLMPGILLLDVRDHPAEGYVRSIPQGFPVERLDKADLP